MPGGLDIFCFCSGVFLALSTKQAGATNRDKREKERREGRELATRPYRDVVFCDFELFLASKDYSIFSNFVEGFLSFDK